MDSPLSRPLNETRQPTAVAAATLPPAPLGGTIRLCLGEPSRGRVIPPRIPWGGLLGAD